ncbi:PLP-dependent aminotransferase family protein [Streptomyces sp. NPDC093261]|uniref:MocR-like pyridoxine biosynthesis transcription factor PdxR n=1 Tax=Streptomyces sp. NPDC093261 TaxID=3366037 RepID=UPI00380C41C9
MRKPWAIPGTDLYLEPTGPGVRRGLTDALREAVRTGRLAPGTRLPSSRSLAADLRLARNTVAEAYADLVAEGWLTARQGSGTRVAEHTLPPRSDRAAPHPRDPGRLPYDLTPGRPDLASFPRAEWLRAARRALASAPHEAFGYGDPRGRVELRTALAGYLSRVRGVRADPDRIVVCAGFAQGLKLLCEVLRDRAPGPPAAPDSSAVESCGPLAVESYGLDVHRNLVERAGLRTVPLPFDGLGTRTDALTGESAVLLNPAHQFPLGGALRPERRAAAVDWARRTGGLVLEDDYDGEFRYDRQPVGALQDLAPDHVAYLGTAGKALAPGLRLGWMVLPPALVQEVVDVRQDGGWSGGVLDQLTLAEFIASGAYDRHVRAARLRYRRRRDALVEAVASRAPRVRVRGIAAGLHAVLELPAGTEASVVRAAAWQGLAVHGLSRFRHPDAATEPLDALVVGFGTPPDHAWAGALEALCRVLP